MSILKCLLVISHVSSVHFCTRLFIGSVMCLQVWVAFSLYDRCAHDCFSRIGIIRNTSLYVECLSTSQLFSASAFSRAIRRLDRGLSELKFNHTRSGLAHLDQLKLVTFCYKLFFLDDRSSLLVF